MKNSTEHIDAYFNGLLVGTQKQDFEERCAVDAAFAEEVALYILIRGSLRETLHMQKQEQFNELYEKLTQQQSKSTSRTAILRKLSIYLAAACLVCILGWILLFRNPTDQRLSEDYIAANFSTLGVTMGNEANHLQQGIAAFNAKDYKKAVQLFEPLVVQAKPEPEAIKNLGITYLVTGKYNEAIIQFEKLADMKLYANPGLFYKAIVLIKRAEGEDKAKAKKILEEVVDKDLMGSKEAKIWLQKL